MMDSTTTDSVNDSNIAMGSTTADSVNDSNIAMESTIIVNEL
jgi:hypothetical protein